MNLIIGGAQPTDTTGMSAIDAKFKGSLKRIAFWNLHLWNTCKGRDPVQTYGGNCEVFSYHQSNTNCNHAAFLVNRSLARSVPTQYGIM